MYIKSMFYSLSTKIFQTELGPVQGWGYHVVPGDHRTDEGVCVRPIHPHPEHHPWGVPRHQQDPRRQGELLWHHHQV